MRIQIIEVLSGVGPAQKDIEILTGQGDGDCGYPFQIGTDYVIYAYENADGRLETGICSGTQPLDQATDDVSYFHAMMHAPDTGSIRVLTGLPGAPGKASAAIIAEQAQSRYRSTTNTVGVAMFSDMPPGEYTIHAESDGNLPDDPKVRVHPKGCTSLTLFRTLRLVGHVMTTTGQPAARVEVQFRSTQDSRGDGVMTGPEGQYEIRIVRPGQYYLGINLNHTPTRETPYPRWFYPGTEDQGSATSIDFTGKPEVRTYDFTLPERQRERAIEGIVLTRDGQPKPRAVVTVRDPSQNVIAQAFADQNGRFALQVFVQTPYRLYAVWPGNTANEAASALPMEIPPDDKPLNLALVLTQPGNLFLEDRRSGGR